jgi:hypothetical protein
MEGHSEMLLDDVTDGQSPAPLQEENDDFEEDEFFFNDLPPSPNDEKLRI